MNFEVQSLSGILRSNDNVCKLSKPTGFLLSGLGCATCCGDKILLQDWPFLYLGRIIRLDKLGQTFRVRLVMRLDGHLHKNSPYQYKQSDLSLQCIAETGCYIQSPDLFTRNDLSPRHHCCCKLSPSVFRGNFGYASKHLLSQGNLALAS